MFLLFFSEFEIKKDFFKQANKWIEENRIIKEEIRTLGFAKTELEKINPTLF